MNITTWILVGAVIFLVVWDGYAAMRWGYTGTISFDILTASKAHPIIPLAMGIVLGHLTWPQ